MGKIIVIEGIDGSGKNTQTTLLLENLEREGVVANKMSFPAYSETFFGGEVGKYLDGVYGGIDEIPAEMAAMLYAGDRFEKKEDILRFIEGDKVLVIDRYVPSNIAHQCAKVVAGKRSELRSWIEKLEYDVYGLPKPDCVVFLDMPADVSQKLVMKKEARSYTEKKKDLHEDDRDHLTTSHDCFRELVELNGWDYVKCTNADGLRSIDDIQNDILSTVLLKI